MIWLRSLLGVRWLPFAAIGVTVGLSGAFGWGYLKGSHSAEERMGRAMQDALAVQAQKFAEIAQQDLDVALRAIMRENEVMREIDAIPIPDTTDCTDPEWLHSYNAAVRAANSARASSAP